MISEFDMDKMLPHWVEHCAVYWTILSTAGVAIASWLSRVLWDPSEINRRWYTLTYELIGRISMSGRKPWKGNSSNPVNISPNQGN